MSEQRHTPGPWMADMDDYATGDSIEVMKEGASIASVYGADDFPCADGEDTESCDTCADFAAECEANARLIAAAPDFEAACAMWILIAGINGAVLPEDLEAWAKEVSSREKRTPVEAARDAVAKATGGGQQ